ncbi:hypothetical protein ABZX12_04225 [Kribbella sp. NPDC003505]|uniref:hypothetical protein n=1 Tax=Kribbella sp. NPDC003505 TaxID=3154448 RepID=UPI0033B83EA8
MTKNLPPGRGGYRAKTVNKKTSSKNETRDGQKSVVPPPPKPSKGGPTSAE